MHDASCSPHVCLNKNVVWMSVYQVPAVLSSAALEDCTKLSRGQPQSKAVCINNIYTYIQSGICRLCCCWRHMIAVDLSLETGLTLKPNTNVQASRLHHLKTKNCICWCQSSTLKNQKTFQNMLTFNIQIKVGISVLNSKT